MSKSPASEASQELHHSRRLWWVAVPLLMIGVGALTFLFSEPPPPKRVVFTTGSEGGAYHAFAVQLAARVEAASNNALEVVLETSKGSVENLNRLATTGEGEAQIAFIQSGIRELALGEIAAGKGDRWTFDLEQGEATAAIASCYSEPLWVFYRSESDIDLLRDLRGKKIGVGAKGSGTEAVAVELLTNNGIRPENATIQAETTSKQVEELLAGELDAIFLVASPQASWVRDLLAAEGVRLMDFVRHRAYARRVKYLRSLEIPQGVISLEENLPSREVTLLAPTAVLYTRQDVHPRVVELFTKAAKGVFGVGGAIDLPGEFPSTAGLDGHVHDAAQRYLLEGEDFLSRNLPYWAVRLISQAKLLLIPLITVLLPAFKLIPVILRFRIKHILKRHYEHLRDAEIKMLSAETPEEMETHLEHLTSLRDELSSLSKHVPGTYQDNLYHWRLHVDLVRRQGEERLAALRG